MDDAWPAPGPRRSLLLFTLLACLAAAVMASPAQARDFNCDASALRITLGGQQTIEPITANRGQTTCKEVKSQTSTTAGPISGGALVAETQVPDMTQATARGGLATLTVSADALAQIPLPTLDAINQIPAVTVPLPANPLLPTSITVDIRPAVQSIIDGIKIGPLLEVNASMATAHAQCVNSQPQLSGSTSVLGLKVLGQTLPTDAAINQALTVYDGQTINPGALDVTKIPLPPAISVLNPSLQAIVQQAIVDQLKTLPPITLPASLLQVSIKPSSQIVGDGGLTQRGLSVTLGVGGQQVLDTVIGEARVSVDSVQCTGVAPPQSLTKAALSCSNRKLALLDVLDRGKYVSLVGVADPRLAGKRVTIRSKADGGKIVARPRVASTGIFHARAALPPQRFRYTNTARYTATYGKQKSLALKLHRRMMFTQLKSRNGRVTLVGQVTRPFSKNRQIVLRQRVSCRKQRVVARLHYDAQGRFRVVLNVPKHGDVGVYRATTMVSYPGGWAPDFRTYTLPGLVRFGR